MPNVSPLTRQLLPATVDVPQVPDRLEHHPSSLDIRVFVLTDRDDDTPFSRRNVAGVFTSIEELRRDITLDRAAVVINFQQAERRSQALLALRGAPEFALLPLFLSKGAVVDTLETQDLCDQILESPAAARERGAEIWRALCGLVGQPTSYNADVRLLRFLHTRPEHHLVPRRSWDHPLGYHYSLLDAFGHDALASSTWLDILHRQKLIEPVSLIGRTRHCPSCDFSHLNYVDVCPNCADADIENIPFLHCFTCGNVAPDIEFARADHLACPKCSTRLRHIGVDYDRALTSFRCKPCGVSFQDPHILAECLHCGKRTAPRDLSRRDVRSWRASEAGHVAARSGGAAAFTPLDHLGFATPAYFTHTLEWMLRLRDRHAEHSFGLLRVRIGNIERLRAGIGRSAASVLLEDFSVHVRQLLRSTDVAARMTEHDLHVLLPYTDHTGSEHTRAKIERLGERFSTADTSGQFAVNVTVVHSSRIAARQHAESIITGSDEGAEG